jgi:hypothetical protein
MHRNKTHKGESKNFGREPTQNNTQEQNQTRGKGEKNLARAIASYNHTPHP